MNPADHFTVVGLTRGEVAAGAMRRITNFTVEELKRRAELQREGANVVERQCEIYFVPRDDEEQSEMLYEMLGVSPKDYFEILFVNDDMMDLAGEFDMPFQHVLGAYGGAELIQRFGGFGTVLRNKAVSRNRL
jgi:hypothetical protein